MQDSISAARAPHTKHSVLSNAAESAQHVVRSTPAIEAGIDGFEHVGKRGEVVVVGREAPCQFPYALDRRKLRAVRWQEQETQVSGVPA